MADSSDIPAGSYTLTLGNSFDPVSKGQKSDQKEPQFHALRYDFKPSSVSSEAETYIAFGNSGDVHVSVPSDGDSMTVYKGSKKEAKPKECLLFFDKKTNTVRLEKITSNIHVKKTRDLDPGTEQALKKGIERLRTSSAYTSPISPPTPDLKQQNLPSPDTSESSTDSDGSSDSDKSNVDTSDDEDESALLEQMQQSKPTPASSVLPTSSLQSERNTSSIMPPAFSNSTNSSSRDKGNSEKYGLALSESSEEDD